MTADVTAQEIVSDVILTGGCEDCLDSAANVGCRVDQGAVNVKKIGRELGHRHVKRSDGHRVRTASWRSRLGRALRPAVAARRLAGRAEALRPPGGSAVAFPRRR